MKKLVLILLIISASASAQKAALGTTLSPDSFEKLLKREDFKRANGRMLVSGIGCQIENEDAVSKFLVSVVCQEKAFAEIGIERINKMILVANGKVRTALSEQLKYKPSEIKMAYNPESKDWSLTNLFTTVDEFGLVQTELLALDFDSEGRFLAMKRIF